MSVHTEAAVPGSSCPDSISLHREVPQPLLSKTMVLLGLGTDPEHGLVDHTDHIHCYVPRVSDLQRGRRSVEEANGALLRSRCDHGCSQCAPPRRLEGEKVEVVVVGVDDAVVDGKGEGVRIRDAQILEGSLVLGIQAARPSCSTWQSTCTA